MSAGIVDESRGQEIIDAIRSDHEQFLHIQDRHDAFHKKLKDRSPFRRPHAQQLVKVLEQAEWRRTPKVVEFFASQWHGLTQTKLIEDAARELREEERCKHFKKTMTGRRAWCKLIKKGIDHKKHRFQPIRWRQQVIKRGLKDQRSPQIYKAMPKLLHRDMHRIVNQQVKAPYFTTTPLLQTAPVEDAQLLRHVRRLDREAEAPNCWQSCLAGIKGTRLMIRSRDVHHNAWFLSLGTAGGSALLVLPMEEKRHMGRSFFSISKTLKRYDFFPVLDWTDVDAWTCTAKSPLGVRTLTGRWLRDVGPVVFMPTSDNPTSLLKAATMTGFSVMPKTGLARVARELGLPVVRDAGVLDILMSIVDHVFPGHTDDVALDVLRARVDLQDEAADLLKEECVVDQLEKQEVERLEKEAHDADDERAEGKKRIRKIIEERIAKKGALVVASGSGSGTGKRKADARKGKAAPASDAKARKYPARMALPKALSGEVLRAFLPDSCRISQDIWSQAWRLQCYGRNFARAWHLYTPAGAAELLIKLAWERAMSLGFEMRCPFSEFKL